MKFYMNFTQPYPLNLHADCILVFIIANDDIAVIVNKDNPLEDITLQQLKGIYTGDILNWEELNEE